MLEGEPAAIDELLARIRKDSRHHGFVVSIDHEVAARKFPNWSMGLLYKLDTADRMERLLTGERLSPEGALEPLDEVNPDSVMGTL